MADRLTPKRLGNDSLVARLYAAIPRRGRRRLLTYAGAGLMLVATSSHALAVCAGDCNGSDTVTIDELILGVNISLGTQPVSACPAFDSNSSNSVTVNELVAAVSSSLKGCSGSLPSSAQATIRVLNRSGVAATVTLHGMFAPQSSVNGAGFASDYTKAGVTIPAACTGSPLSCTCGTGNSCKCDAPGFSGVPRCEVPVTNLAPGTWIHDISVSQPALGQKQFRQSLLVSDPVKPNVVESNQTYDWTVFQTVLKVTSFADSGADTLRNRITAANNVVNPRPVLIFFDFPSEGTINLTGNLSVTGNDTVIDGTNAMGDPSPVQAFTARKYKTMLNFTGTAKFVVQGPGVQLVGLHIGRTLGPDNGLVGADLNQVFFGTTSKTGRVRTCRLDGGAAARVNADCPKTTPPTNPAQGKDCVDAERTGATSFAEAIIVEDTELRHCYDRPAKSQDGYLILRDNWIHNNLRGGPFGQAGEIAPMNGGVGSHLKTERNLLEHNGKNCPAAMICSGGSLNDQLCAPMQACPGGPNSNDGCPGGSCIPDPSFSGNPASCGTTATRPEAAQISAEVATTPGTYVELQTNGDVLRNGLRDGFSLQQNAYGQINNAFVCGMTNLGIEVNSDAGSAATPILVRGTSSVLNARGVQLNMADSVVGKVNFGTDTGPGNNAFAANSNRNFRNDSATETILSRSNQWERCGNLASCDLAAIGNSDVTGAADFTPAQAHRNSGSLTITTVSPTKVASKGAIVHITGAGFNAIEGYKSYAAGTNGCPAGGGTCAAATNCATLNQGNTCNPVKGTCVEFLDPATLQWKPADAILGITPTHLVVASPIACGGPTKIRVRRLTNTGGVFLPIPEFAFCNN